MKGPFGAIGNGVKGVGATHLGGKSKEVLIWEAKDSLSGL